jgi:GTP cyclohydrolase IA
MSWNEDLHREFEAIQVNQRKISDDQFGKFEGYAAEIFSAFGMDLNTPATKDTPRRFVQALFDATAGYDGDPKLLTVFETECHGEPDCRISQVIEGPIHFFALCEHHALPFYGHPHLGS